MLAENKNMVNVLTEISINRSKEEVSRYASNPDNAPEWYVNIKSAKWKTPKPLSVGSKIEFTARFLGRDLAYTYEIIEYVPGERLVMRTAEGPFPMKTTYTWKEVDKDKTLMTLKNSGQPSGFSRLVTPIMELMMRKANKKDLLLLKQILESSAPGVEI
jgi:uncharacterized membrane protein